MNVKKKRAQETKKMYKWESIREEYKRKMKENRRKSKDAEMANKN